jgi:hypothetical protein
MCYARRMITNGVSRMLVATTHTQTSQSESRVSSRDIQRALHAYPTTHRFIREAMYANHVLTASADSFVHPFHEPWMKHLTREHSVVYATQASYLLIQAAIDAGEFPYLTASHYRYVCRSEEGLMSKISVRFHRTAPMPSCVQIVAKIENIRKLRDAVYVNCLYRISDICTMQAWLTSPVG